MASGHVQRRIQMYTSLNTTLAHQRQCNSAPDKQLLNTTQFLSLGSHTLPPPQCAIITSRLIAALWSANSSLTPFLVQRKPISAYQVRATCTKQGRADSARSHGQVSCTRYQQGLLYGIVELTPHVYRNGCRPNVCVCVCGGCWR